MLLFAEQEAHVAAEEAQALAVEAQATADERAAELRLAQESLKSMREECNERWVSKWSCLYLNRVIMFVLCRCLSVF